MLPITTTDFYDMYGKIRRTLSDWLGALKKLAPNFRSKNGDKPINKRYQSTSTSSEYTFSLDSSAYPSRGRDMRNTITLRKSISTTYIKLPVAHRPKWLRRSRSHGMEDSDDDYFECCGPGNRASHAVSLRYSSAKRAPKAGKPY
ncbi:hypothetical protein TWF481_010385 [Arthrobotrys musiformis]|uniref:Uncharacterized protein n=1 Tax=Arthrobotrys musiformis TaxID=47236 RepID=A0AAV9W2H5_9PEZI